MGGRGTRPSPIPGAQRMAGHTAGPLGCLMLFSSICIYSSEANTVFRNTQALFLKIIF